MRRASLMLLLLCLVFAFGAGEALAQGLGFKGIGGRLSFVKPEDVDGTIGFGAHADLGEIIENLTLYPSLEYWSKGEGPADFSQFAVNADARYYFPSSNNLSFFAGGGIAFLFNSVDVGPFDDSETDIGLDLLGGVDVPVSDNLVFTGSAKFVISDGNVFRITAGLTYLIGE